MQDKQANEDCIEILLKAGASVNHSNVNGDTALFFAASEGHYNCAKLLIQEGADVNTRGDQDWTALSIAAYFGRKHCTVLLLKSGAYINTAVDERAFGGPAGRKLYSALRPNGLCIVCGRPRR